MGPKVYTLENIKQSKASGLNENHPVTIIGAAVFKDSVIVCELIRN